jgi:hypothetical protein
MAWTLHTAVASGQAIAAGTTNTIRTSLQELQAWSQLYRYRQTRAAASYAVGDVDLAGTVTVVENTGGFTGNGGSTPLVVPVGGTYLARISWTPGAAWPTSIRPMSGGSVGYEFQNGTALPQQHCVLVFLAAAGTIQFVLRNGSAGTLTGVTASVVVELISPTAMP